MPEENYAESITPHHPLYGHDINRKNSDINYFFFLYIYNLHLFEQKTYSHQVLTYLNVPGIPVRKPLKNRQIDS